MIDLPAPEVRLEAIYRTVLEANRPECNSACIRPTLARTNRGAYVTRRLTIKLDPEYMLKRTDPEYALVMCHEFAHMLGVRDERQADAKGLEMAAKAGYDRGEMLAFLRKVRGPRL